MPAFEKVLEQAHTAITNTLNTREILTVLSRRGYGEEELQQGLALYETARDLMQLYSDAQFRKMNTDDNFEQSWSIAKFQHQNHLKATRLMLKLNPAANNLLNLEESVPRYYEPWYAQVSAFYLFLRNHPELHAILAAVGITLESIHAFIDSLGRLQGLRLQALNEAGNVKSVQRQRRQACDALGQWMKEFLKFVRPTFAGNPEILVQLGVGSSARRRTRKEKQPIDSRPTVDAEKVAGAA